MSFDSIPRQNRKTSRLHATVAKLKTFAHVLQVRKQYDTAHEALKGFWLAGSVSRPPSNGQSSSGNGFTTSSESSDSYTTASTGSARAGQSSREYLNSQGHHDSSPNTQETPPSSTYHRFAGSTLTFWGTAPMSPTLFAESYPPATTDSSRSTSNSTSNSKLNSSGKHSRSTSSSSNPSELDLLREGITVRDFVYCDRVARVATPAPVSTALYEAKALHPLRSNALAKVPSVKEPKGGNGPVGRDTVELPTPCQRAAECGEQDATANALLAAINTNTPEKKPNVVVVRAGASENGSDDDEDELAFHGTPRHLGAAAHVPRVQVQGLEIAGRECRGAFELGEEKEGASELDGVRGDNPSSHGEEIEGSMEESTGSIHDSPLESDCMKESLTFQEEFLEESATKNAQAIINENPINEGDDEQCNIEPQEDPDYLPSPQPQTPRYRTVSEATSALTTIHHNVHTPWATWHVPSPSSSADSAAEDSAAEDELYVPCHDISPRRTQALEWFAEQLRQGAHVPAEVYDRAVGLADAVLGFWEREGEDGVGGIHDSDEGDNGDDGDGDQEEGSGGIDEGEVDVPGRWFNVPSPTASDVSSGGSDLCDEHEATGDVEETSEIFAPGPLPKVSIPRIISNGGEDYGNAASSTNDLDTPPLAQADDAEYDVDGFLIDPSSLPSTPQTANSVTNPCPDDLGTPLLEQADDAEYDVDGFLIDTSSLLDSSKNEDEVEDEVATQCPDTFRTRVHSLTTWLVAQSHAGVLTHLKRCNSACGPVHTHNDGSQLWSSGSPPTYKLIRFSQTTETLRTDLDRLAAEISRAGSLARELGIATGPSVAEILVGTLVEASSYGGVSKLQLEARVKQAQRLAVQAWGELEGREGMLGDNAGWRFEWQRKGLRAVSEGGTEGGDEAEMF